MSWHLRLTKITTHSPCKKTNYAFYHKKLPKVAKRKRIITHYYENNMKLRFGKNSRLQTRLGWWGILSIHHRLYYSWNTAHIQWDAQSRVTLLYHYIDAKCTFEATLTSDFTTSSPSIIFSKINKMLVTYWKLCTIMFSKSVQLFWYAQCKMMYYYNSGFKTFTATMYNS